MKVRLIALALILAATPLFAQNPVRKTVVIRDGKVISGDVHDVQVLQDFIGKRAYLGVTLVDLTNELREHYGAPKTAGVLVGSVEEGSPAAKAGVRVGDIVVAIDGADVDSSGDLRKALREKKDGDNVRIEVLRGRARQALVASVVEREGMRMPVVEIEELRERFNSPEWKARVESFGDCGALQSRIRDLESRLKDLEKKLQK